jgi:hypothetical protein
MTAGRLERSVEKLFPNKEISMKNTLMRSILHSSISKGLLQAGTFGAVALIGLVLSSQPAVAQTTYNYKGNPFTGFSCGPNADDSATMDCSTPAPTNTYTSYTATDFVSATLTLGSPLPANFTLQDVRTFSGFTLTMNDGQHTVTVADALGGMFAEVSTDASGQINQWRFVLNTGGAENGGIATINEGASVFDQGVLACCDPTVSGNLADNFSMPGIWSGGAVSPAAAVTNLINVVANPLLGLTHAQITGLTDILKGALLSINAGRSKLAVAELNAFIAAVRILRGIHQISASTANTLITAAQAIVPLL